jgi:hypothetical protein
MVNFLECRTSGAALRLPTDAFRHASGKAAHSAAGVGATGREAAHTRASHDHAASTKLQ